MEKKIRETAPSMAKSLTDNSWFSYLTIMLLQLKVIWGMWIYRDLPFGDSSQYFKTAYWWFENFKVLFPWSPLYTSFWGTLLFLSDDAYVVSILHRIIIVFLLTILVLAVMRRLLPSGIAWLMGAWWAVLPINFNAMYEVHLFSVIPVLAACLIVLVKKGIWARSCALAIVVANTFLLRNEYIVVAIIFGVICFVWELGQAKALKGKLRTIPRFRHYLLGYGAPLLLVGALIFFFYSRSVVQYPELSWYVKAKHVMNMGQVYAFGYQQRHPEWEKNAMTEYPELIKEHFGAPDLTLSEMLWKNPKAVLDNMLWNLYLTPFGIQLLLFNTTSSTITPDYCPVSYNRSTSLILSVFTSLILISGFILFYKDRQFWWRQWVKDRILGWLMMFSWVPLAIIIIITQRPRPSYIFPLGIFLMATVGMAVYIIIHRWPFIEKQLVKWMPLVILVMMIAVPRYYPGHSNGRPLLDIYRRLTPFKAEICNPDARPVVSDYSREMQNYFCHIPDYTRIKTYSVFDGQLPEIPLYRVLENNGINLIYIDKALWASLMASQPQKIMIESPESVGWKVLARDNNEQWMLLFRNPVPQS
ncbi:MAG: hypothetical protein WAZ60_01445 [Desulfosalsimonadaceae bacterium]